MHLLGAAYARGLAAQHMPAARGFVRFTTRDEAANALQVVNHVASPGERGCASRPCVHRATKGANVGAEPQRADGADVA